MKGPEASSHPGDGGGEGMEKLLGPYPEVKEGSRGGAPRGPFEADRPDLARIIASCTAACTAARSSVRSASSRVAFARASFFLSRIMDRKSKRTWGSDEGDRCHVGTFGWDFEWGREWRSGCPWTMITERST